MATDDLSFLSDRVRQALSADEQVLAQLRRFDDEYADLQRVVRELPEKTSHDIMVPFTDVAFFPGRLIHTNELTILLGSDLYAERSASQTLEIIERRREMLREKISGADAGVDAMGARLGALDAVAAADGEGASTSGGGAFATRQEGRAVLTSKPDGTVEITESYEDDEPLETFDDGARGGPSTGVRTAGEESRQLDDFIARLEALRGRHLVAPLFLLLAARARLDRWRESVLDRAGRDLLVSRHPDSHVAEGVARAVERVPRLVAPAAHEHQLRTALLAVEARHVQGIAVDAVHGNHERVPHLPPLRLVRIARVEPLQRLERRPLGPHALPLEAGALARVVQPWQLLGAARLLVLRNQLLGQIDLRLLDRQLRRSVGHALRSSCQRCLGVALAASVAQVENG